MKQFLFLTLLTTHLFSFAASPAEAAGVGFEIQVGRGSGYGWQNDYRSDWNRGWNNSWDRGWNHHWHDDWGYDPGLRRRGPLGFEIERPSQGYYDRWQDPLPEWRRWDRPTHWESGDTRFEFRAEPIRPITPPAPRVSKPEPLVQEKNAPAPKAKQIEINESDDDEDEEAEATLRYCPSARGYYPAVRKCPEGWTYQKGTRVQ